MQFARDRERVVRKSFTLMELLVVMMIIAILLSLLLPVLKKSKGEARLAVCLGQAAQIGRATSLFAVDNNNRYPVSNHVTGAMETMLEPYTYTGGKNAAGIKMQKLMKCSEDPPRTDGRFNRSYIFNGDEIWANGSKDNTDYGVIGRVDSASGSRKVSEVMGSANLILETHYKWSDMGYLGSWNACTFRKSWWTFNYLTTFHGQKRISSTYADGSGRIIRYDTVPENNYAILKVR